MIAPRRAAAIAAALLLIAAQAALGAERSRTVRAAFQRQHPCPSTGQLRGPCPGYQVDHRAALVCGGRDELGNLQWLSVPEHKAKTRIDVAVCKITHSR